MRSPICTLQSCCHEKTTTKLTSVCNKVCQATNTRSYIQLQPLQELSSRERTTSVNSALDITVTVAVTEFAVQRAPKPHKLQQHSVLRHGSIQEHVILELPSTAARVTSVRSLLSTRHLYWRRVLLCSARRRPSSAR